MSEKIPFPRFQNYLKGVVEPSVDAPLSFAISHSLSKWVFDLFRNTMIAGVLRYLSDRNGGWVLWIASEVAFITLLVFCLSYVNAWVFRPFHLLKNKRAGFILDSIVTLSIILPIWYCVVKGVPLAIEAVAQGQVK